MEDKKLINVSKQEQKEFLDSFDTVFCDVDGVLATGIVNHIDGASDAIHSLRRLKKKLYFITNNSTAPKEVVMERHKPFGIAKEEIVRPIDIIIWYLKKLKFDKDIYLIGYGTVRKELENAGFTVLQDEGTPLEESIVGLTKLLRSIRPNVGAVVVEFSLNVNFAQLQTAIEYIRRNKALFLAGSIDCVLPLLKSKVIGCGSFVKLVEEISGVAPRVLSKPGDEFREVLEEHLGPFDHKRILFIGDSVETDMPFATKCGMQKLLTLTGMTKPQDLENWKFDESFKPDYVLDSIRDLSVIINDLEN